MPGQFKHQIMKHYDEEIIQCIQHFLTGTLTEEKRVKLQRWLEEHPLHMDFFEDICRKQDFSEDFETYVNINRDNAWRKVASVTKVAAIRKTHRLKIYRWAAAVILPLMLAFGGYLGYLQVKKESAVSTGIADIYPVKPAAILRLSDNRTVSLGEEVSDQLKVAEGIQVQKDTSRVVYPQTIAGNAVEYHTLEIPRGGEYSVTLSDGSVVYLNSGSQLRYPVAFAKEKREVYLSGEAYFEVSKDSERPFLVLTDHLSIRVYGTSFNVNTFTQKNVLTVLVEGKIGIRSTASDEEYQVSPGQLASYDAETESIQISQVDVFPYIAWKDHIFVFEDKSLEEIMNTLSQWYDVEVFFQIDNLRDLHFTGHLGRYESISSILDAISGVTRVKFSVKGRTIIVTE